MKLLKVNCDDNTKENHAEFVIVNDEEFEEMKREKKKVLSRGKINKTYASCIKPRRTGGEQGRILTFRRECKKEE